MAFNKAKSLENAQKLVNQGKLPQAIAEYQTILKHEPTDQVVLMTVGDLYVRAGDVKQSLEYFEKLAQQFITDGFISKSIAIYKKISKLAPEEIHPLERLAELYVQQGVMSEARPVYLQIAEVHIKGGRSPQAVEVLRKLLELEPDNQRVQVRLAELHQTLGQNKEAAAAFLFSAQKMIEKNLFHDALKMAERAAKLDAKNPKALLLRARCVAGQGKPEDAIRLLEAVPEAERSPETTGLLVDFYVKSGHGSKAVEMARNALQWGAQSAPMVCDVAGALLESGEIDSALELLGDVRGPMLEAGETEKLAHVLSHAGDRARGRMEPHLWLAEIYRNAGDQFRLPEALDNLGEAAVAAGKLDEAARAFEELAALQPDNESVRQKLNGVLERLGRPGAPAEAGRPAPVAPADLPAEFAVESPPPAPVVEASLDEETTAYVNQSLTDVDLFSGYGLAQKAIDLLENVLKRAPTHTGVLEKLMDTYIGAGNDRRTAEIAGQLEQIYAGRGDTANAERFTQMRRRYQRAAGLPETAAPPAAPPPSAEFVIPTVPADTSGFEEIPLEVSAEPSPEVPPVIPVASAEGEGTAQDVDLSAEWAAMSEATMPAEAAPPPPAPEPMPVAPPPPAQPEAFEVSLDDAWSAPVADAAQVPPPAEKAPPPVKAAAPEREPAPAPVAEAAAEEAVEFELQEQPAQEGAVVAAPDGGLSTGDFLSDLAQEIDGLDLGAKAPSAGAAPPSPRTPSAPPAAAGGASAQLNEVFEEFRQELGEMGEEVEDLETHYNLGIAYREMGLLEEGIGEFQKVAKLMGAGRTFRYAMQCYTLLGLSFMDKAQPTIAAVWYLKALTTPNLEQESILALRYDLGVAQEQAGDVKAALESFSQVYAMNIDYRDVAERIAALQKKR